MVKAVQAFEEMQMLWADVELDPISDDESVAPSEASKVPDARSKRKKEDAAAKNSKFKRMGDLLQLSRAAACGYWLWLLWLCLATVSPSHTEPCVQAL